MANMSHCRFRNTEEDLRDCLRALHRGDTTEISQEEISAGKRMFKKFLEYCVDMEIIEGYDNGRVEEVFENHNNEN